jgi:putative holliday junction resolvase
MSVKIGLDFGTVRVGVAISAAGSKVALPHSTLVNDENLIQSLRDLIKNKQAQVIYLGLPLNLKGQVTQSAKKALDLAVQLQAVLPEVPIRMIDERFTSSNAEAKLQAAGLTTRETKGLVDQVSAVAVLDQALEIEQRSGSLAGTSPQDWIGE